MSTRSFIITAVMLTICGFVSGAPDCSKNIELEAVLEGCCDQPKWNEDDSIEAKCRGTSISCMAECMLNETKILTNGKAEMGKVRTVIEAELKEDPEFIPIIVNAFETCSAKLQRMTPESTPPSDGCNPYSMLLISCVNTQSLANCPQSKWKSGTECNDAKDYVQLCL